MRLLLLTYICTRAKTQTVTQTTLRADGGIGVEMLKDQPETQQTALNVFGKRRLDFQPNLRDQEAAGSSPATPTKIG